MRLVILHKLLKSYLLDSVRCLAAGLVVLSFTRSDLEEAFVDLIGHAQVVFIVVVLLRTGISHRIRVVDKQMALRRLGRFLRTAMTTSRRVVRSQIMRPVQVTIVPKDTKLLLLIRLVFFISKLALFVSTLIVVLLPLIVVTLVEVFFRIVSLLVEEIVLKRRMVSVLFTARN